MERFNFQSEYIELEIKKRNAKRILLQFPEGIKQNSLDIVSELQKKMDVEFIISGESCWGGCDINVDEAKRVGADLIVHFGHSQFMETKIPIVYVYVKDERDITELIKKSIKNLDKFYRIGLVTSIQHSHWLNSVKEFYEKNDKKVVIPAGLGRVFSEGQIIGCEYSGLKQIKEKVDCVVIIGNRFHALGVALALPDKTVFLIDSYNNVVENMDKFRDKIIKQRFVSIDKFKQAKKIGIIVSLKPGQHFGNVELIKKEFEKQKKEVLIITMNEISNEKLMNFYNLDGFVELACPRIATDDYSRYEKPVLTSREALVVLGKLTWEDLLEKGFV